MYYSKSPLPPPQKGGIVYTVLLFFLMSCGAKQSTTCDGNSTVPCNIDSQLVAQQKAEALNNDVEPPSFVSKILLSDISSTGAKANWNRASDTLTTQAELEYKVVYALDELPISVNVLSEGTPPAGVVVSKDWSKDLTSTLISDLLPDTTYQVAVLVRDAKHNLSMLSPKILTTNSLSTPTIGSVINFSNLKSSGLTLNWGDASDAVTTSATLEYKVVKATEAASIDTVTKVEAVVGQDLLLDWSPNTLTQNITSLSPSTTYNFAVLVKNEFGNKSLYPPSSVTTLANDVVSVTSSLLFRDITGVSTRLYWDAPTKGANSGELKYKIVKASNAPAIDTIEEIETVVGDNIIQNWLPRVDADMTVGKLVSGLSLGTPYFFAMLVKDELNNIAIYSPISLVTLAENIPVATPTPTSTPTISMSDITAWTNALGSTTVSAAIANGNYDSKACLLTDNNLLAVNIKSGTSIFGVSGSLTPAYVSCVDNTSNVGQCSAAAGRYVTSTLGGNVTGINASLSKTIPLGYYDGTTSATMSDTNLTAANISFGVSIFGVTGTASGPYLACSENSDIANLLQCSTSTNSYVYSAAKGGRSANCGAGLNVSACWTNATSEYVTSIIGGNVIGANSVLSKTIPLGYYDGTTSATMSDTNLTAANIKSGTAIFGVTGNLTVAYANCVDNISNAGQCSTAVGRYVTAAAGADITTWTNGSATTTVSATIPTGFYSGKSTLLTAADLVAANILSGKSIFGVSGSLTAAYASCIDNISNAGQCSIAAGRYVTATLGSSINGTNASLSKVIPLGYYDGTTSATMSDTNLTAANIKSGTAIFGVTGTAPFTTSNAYRDQATTPISQITETSTYAGGASLPDTYREVPDIAKDDDGYVSAAVSSPQVTFVSRSNGIWNTGIVRKVCGKGVNTSLADKITDCYNQHSGTKPSWNAGVVGKISWDGTIKGNAGQGSWTLVTVYSDTIANGGTCNTTCKEVWRDDRTGLLWSDRLGNSDNWCRASGNAGPDASGYCTNTTIQPASPQSWCAEVGTLAAVTSGGENYSTPTYHAFKGAIGKNTAVSVRWRLPTKYDYQMADNNGVRFVVPGMADVGGGYEWSASVYSSATAAAWIFHGATGAVSTTNRNDAKMVRCVGR